MPMDRTTYKNKHKSAHYDRLELAVPKGFKQIVQGLASGQEMSVNGYLLHLIQQDQESLYDAMQIADKNREKLFGITGNTKNGYDIVFTDGHCKHCDTKKEVRAYVVEYCGK